MGSWYETCAISNLPIKYDDEFFIFIIKKNQSSYKEWAAKGVSDGWYSPVSLVINAKFDDNESIIAFDYKEKDISNLIIEIRNSEKENYELMFVLKSMYSIIINEMKIRHNLYNKYLDQTNNFITQSKIVEKGIFSSWNDVIPGRFIKFFCEYNNEMRSLLDEISETNNEVLKERMIELFLFHYGLKVMRKMWHPSNGRGSQDKEYFLHKKISEEIINKEEFEKQKWLKENMLDDDQSDEDITKTHIWYL